MGKANFFMDQAIDGVRQFNILSSPNWLSGDFGDF